jgi:putative two-component system response regulator
MRAPMDTQTILPTVLIIDDSPESIDVLRSVLGSEYRLRVAINGSKAIEISESLNPDIILLDVMMPEMDGYETCRRLKENANTANVPIIFVTTLSETESQLKGLELGAVDYITKPYTASLVRSRVRAHVALHRQSEELKELVRQRTHELLETRLEIIRRLGRAAEYRDNETGMHIMRMSHMTRLLALAHGLSEARAELLFQASPMHDVGKIGIPDSILLKPGKLTPDEWEIIKRHTTIGAEIIGDHGSDLIVLARMVALRHHERWDGGGYPGGLKHTNIPVEARIVALADVFDALMSVRPYKPAWTLDDTLQYIFAQRAQHFDPDLIDAFVQVLPECLRVRETYRDD